MTKFRPSTARFTVPVEHCDVHDLPKLRSYRAKWMEWMDWYELRDEEPHSIQNQMHQMFFNDLVYRSVVSVRYSVPEDLVISARNSTLSHLLDTGYVTSQVMAIRKLLDSRRDVVSVKRLLDDVKTHRALITREVYVAGDGAPYDYEACLRAALLSSEEVQIWGIKAPGLSHALRAKYRHETFDVLSDKQQHQRERNNLIANDVFIELDKWIHSVEAQELIALSHKFLAHAANLVSRESISSKSKYIRYSQIDEAQRAIVRVERAIIDNILDYGVGRDVIPIAPLGVFGGLEHPYAPVEAQEAMSARWDELEGERNGWSRGVLEELGRLIGSVQEKADPSLHSG